MDLTPFLSMLATMSDDDIANASGATVEQVAAYRAAQTAPAEQAEPKPARKPKASKPETAPPEAEAAPATESAPACVRVVKSAPGVRLPGATFGRGVQARDIHSGKVAAHLWEHHRELVEPFPKA